MSAVAVALLFALDARDPDGIAADEIPLVSRIVSVAEEYNAMTSNRPYRDAMPSRVARMRLAKESKVSSTPMWLSLSRRSWPMQQRTIEPPPAKTLVPRQH